jgi:hypothetical protein
MLNGKKQNAFGPIPVIFILYSSKLIVKQMEEQFLIVFLEPLIQELKVLLIDGFNVNYNYPPPLFSPMLPIDNGGSKLWAILMLWIGDHPSQCMVGGLKDGGYDTCQWDVIVKGLVSCNVVYLNNRRQAWHLPPSQTIQSLFKEVNILYFIT